MSFADAWTRIEQETGLKNQNEFAAAINISQAVVSKYKQRNIFQIEWAYAIAQKYGLLTEWIMTGTGPKRLSEAGEPCPDQDTSPKGIIEEWVQYVRENEGGDGRIVMELSLQVDEFKEWYQEHKSKSSLDKSPEKKSLAA
jgi:hypothetical protein